MGKTVALITLILGIIIAAIGVIGAAPIGPTTGPAISNPTIPFTAGIWIVGIIVMLLSPIAYVSGSD